MILQRKCNQSESSFSHGQHELGLVASNVFLRPCPMQINSTEQKNSCEANIRSAAQEITCLL
jgi:hypothetical protein